MRRVHILNLTGIASLDTENARDTPTMMKQGDHEPLGLYKRRFEAAVKIAKELKLNIFTDASMIHRFLRSLNSTYSAYVREQFKRLIAGDSIPEDIEAYIEAATSSVWDTRLKSSDHMPYAYSSSYL